MIFEEIVDKIKDDYIYIAFGPNDMHKISLEMAKICYSGNTVTGIYSSKGKLVIEVHSNRIRQGVCEYQYE